MQYLWLHCTIFMIAAFFLCNNSAFALFNDYSSDGPDSDETVECFVVKNGRNPKSDTKLKYILLWTSSLLPAYGWGSHYNYIRSGQQSFIGKNCHFKNCFITTDVNFRENHTQFDMIVFFARDPGLTLPKKRSPHQKFVFMSREPYKLRAAHADALNGYFNWTWTFKLDSDLPWEPFIIRNVWGNIVGPQKDMKWLPQKNMLPLTGNLRRVLREKTKAAAMFLSECKLPDKRYISNLRNILAKQYNLSLDIYGACFDLQCPSESEDTEESCNQLLRRDYYFNLVFEKFCSEDYVSEELLRPMKYNAVPIVYGCAGYNKFLPQKSYLDASSMTPAALAITIHKLIYNFTEYADYFRWTNYYTYHETDEGEDSDVFCRMCALLNNDTKLQTDSVYEHFQKWWHKNPSSKRLTRPGRRSILSTAPESNVDPSSSVHLISTLGAGPSVSTDLDAVTILDSSPRSTRGSSIILKPSPSSIKAKNPKSNWIQEAWDSLNSPDAWQYLLALY